MSGADTDAVDLAAWIAGRDEAAFKRLVDRHHGLVRSVCRRQLGDGDAADEAAQAVFIVLARRAAAVHDARVLGTWLHGVALRVCQSSRRATARRARHEQEAAMREAESRRAAVAAPFPWAELRPHLDEAIAALSRPEREAVIAHYLLRLPQATVARRLGISESAVRKRVGAALDKLRSWFSRRGSRVGAAALLAGLMEEANATEPGLAAACAQAALHPTAAAGASALASGAMGVGLAKALAMSAILAAVLAGAALTGLVLARAPATAASAARVPTADSSGQVVLRYDFDDGLRPESLVDGALVTAPPRAGSRYCLAAVAKPLGGSGEKHEIQFARKGDGLFTAHAGMRIGFDCWVAGRGGTLAVWAWNDTKKSEMRLEIARDAVGSWFHAGVPLDALRAQDDPARVIDDGDLIMNLTIGAFGVANDQLFIDDLTVTRMR